MVYFLKSATMDVSPSRFMSMEPRYVQTSSKREDLSDSLLKHQTMEVSSMFSVFLEASQLPLYGESDMNVQSLYSRAFVLKIEGALNSDFNGIQLLASVSWCSTRFHRHYFFWSSLLEYCKTIWDLFSSRRTRVSSKWCVSRRSKIGMCLHFTNKQMSRWTATTATTSKATSHVSENACWRRPGHHMKEGEIFQFQS